MVVHNSIPNKEINQPLKKTSSTKISKPKELKKVTKSSNNKSDSSNIKSTQKSSNIKPDSPKVKSIGKMENISMWKSSKIEPVSKSTAKSSHSKSVGKLEIKTISKSLEDIPVIKSTSKNLEGNLEHSKSKVKAMPKNSKPIAQQLIKAYQEVDPFTQDKLKYLIQKENIQFSKEFINVTMQILKEHSTL